MSNYTGYSNYQKQQIDGILSRLTTAEQTITNNKTTYDNKVNDFNSINSDIRSVVFYNDSYIDSEISSLVNIDNILGSTLTSHITGPYTTKTNQLAEEDTRLDNYLKSHIENVYNVRVSSLNLEDSKIYSVIYSHIFDFDADVTSLQNVDQMLNSRIFSHIGVFNTSINSLIAVDTDINNSISNKNSSINTKVSQLEENDAELRLKDATLNTKLVSHIGFFDSEMLSLRNSDTKINTTLDTYIERYNTKVNDLINADNRIDSTIDSHISVFDNQVTLLKGMDSTLESSLQSHIKIYVNQVSLFYENDSTIRSMIGDNSEVNNGAIESLQAVDSVLSSTINSHISVFGTTVSDLRDVDSTILSTLNKHINSAFNPEVSMLHYEDSVLMDMLSLHIGNYDNRVGLLDTDYNLLNDSLNTHIGVYDSKMGQLDSINASDDSRLFSLESRVEYVENEISTTIQLLIESRITIEAFSLIEERLEAEDSRLYDSLALKIAKSLQSEIDFNQDSRINEKVEIVTYDSKMSVLDFYNSAWEGRLRAIEEFARAMLATYTITKPDNTIYTFDGVVQKLALAPFPASAVKKLTKANGDKGLRFSFTAYGYNVLLNKYQIVVSAAGFEETKDVFKADLTATSPANGTYYYNYIRSGTAAQSHSDIFTPGALQNATIKLLDRSGSLVFAYSVTSDELGAMSNENIA
jgi:hypothetical protein